MLLLICNRELLFIGKREDEDDMAKSTKTYEERIRALEKKEQESIEATKKLIAQRKELEKRKKAEESKKRTHRLCQIGGAVESVLGCPIEEEDLPKLIGFLKRQETNGKFFSKAFYAGFNTIQAGQIEYCNGNISIGIRIRRTHFYTSCFIIIKITNQTS